MDICFAIQYTLCRKTLHCIWPSQRTPLGNEAVLFRDFFPPPRAAKLYAPPSNLGLDGDEERFPHHDDLLEGHQEPTSPGTRMVFVG